MDTANDGAASRLPAAVLLISCVTFLLVSLTLGHVFEGKPRHALGVRSRYGVIGYDTSLGTLSPVPCHVLLLLSLFLFIQSILFQFVFTPQAMELAGIGFCMMPGTVVCLIVWIWYGNCTLWVSNPGGARPHKITREPRWDAIDAVDVDPLYGGGSENGAGDRDDGGKGVRWRCAVAGDSHDVTLARFGLLSTSSGGKSEQPRDDHNRLKLGLTGEPAGRQIWTWSRRDGEGDGREGGQRGGGDGVAVVVDEELVQRLARGGRRQEKFDPSSNPNSADVIFRAQQIRSYLIRNGNAVPPDLQLEETGGGSDAKDSTGVATAMATTTTTEAARLATRRALAFYSMLQTDDGHWAGDYGGPHFLMPGLIVSWYVMGRPDKMLDVEQRRMMRKYLRSHQQTDGGWGTHIESPSTMFGSVLCYVSLRLLGVEAQDSACRRGRDFIRKEGGALYASSWAKFWLCLLGCMDWKGHNSVPPEMWLLPNWFPFHPGRLWCHCRMVYLPMGYLYGSRFVYSLAENDPLIADLRKELYVEDYGSISWDETRHMVAHMDNYSPLPHVMKVLQNILARYESWRFLRPVRDRVRAAGLGFCIEYMRAEDLQTNYIDIGPVNKALNMLSTFHAAKGDVNDTAVQNHMMRVADYLWLAEDGMKMQGYNGSQCWDTSFAIQAFSECKLLDEFPLVSTKVWRYLERTQILSTEVSRASPAYLFESSSNRDKYYRHVSRGGWPFSTSAHGWPISDCTGEGLKATLALIDCETVQEGIQKRVLKPIGEERLFDAVNVILTLQNEDGGWATYENNRGFGWYEQLNPSEVFGDIMIDYSYVECSMASLTALAEFSEKYPSHRTRDIAESIRRGRSFMKRIQRSDGSWYGSWACCFCYGCWFGIEGLVTAGEPRSSGAIKKCVRFLLSHQRDNGGWGEDFTSCYDKSYARNGMCSYGDKGSGVVSTSWALLALSAAKCGDVDAMRRGVKYLLERQLPSGDWPQEGICGVFNRTCGITYTSYRNVFSMWALGRCIGVYGDAMDSK